jgi:hypothetical protein
LYINEHNTPIGNSVGIIVGGRRLGVTVALADYFTTFAFPNRLRIRSG